MIKGVLFLAEALLFREEAKEFASWTILQHEEKFFLVLERVEQFYNEGVVHSDENVAFCHDVVFLFSFLDIFFLKDFHGVNTVIVLAFLANEDNLGV